MAKKEKPEKEKKEKKQKGKKGAEQQPAPASPVPPAGKKSKKKGKGKKGAPETPVDTSKLTAEQLTQVQIEEAIKESQDPSSRLKKLRSPISVRSCLLNLLILVLLTVAIVILCCYLMLDKETFNLWVVIKDILDKFHITSFFSKIGQWFKGVFS